MIMDTCYREREREIETGETRVADVVIPRDLLSRARRASYRNASLYIIRALCIAPRERCSAETI